MLEFCLVYEKDLHQKVVALKNDLAFNNVFVQIFNQKEYSSIIFAFDKDNKIIVQKIKNFISDTIFNYYKYSYLLKHLNNFDDELTKLLLNALVNYDIENEREDVFSKLEFGKDLVLTSFVNFKLKNLKQKWFEMCSLTNENEEIINDEKIYINLLKFLLSKSENKIDLIKCEFLRSNLLKCCFNDKKVRFFKVKDLLNFVVKYNPKQIELSLKTKNLKSKNCLLLNSLANNF